MLWLQRDHFDFNGLWENVEFELLATYDVVAAPGWHIEQRPQPCNEIWLLRSGTCDLCINSQEHRATVGDVVVLSAGQHRITSNKATSPLSLQGFSFRTRLLGDIDFVTLLDVPAVVSSAQLSGNQSTFCLQEFLSRAVQESRISNADSIFAVKVCCNLPSPKFCVWLMPMLSAVPLRYNNVRSKICEYGLTTM
jgi:hypothetical protein